MASDGERASTGKAKRTSQHALHKTNSVTRKRPPQKSTAKKASSGPAKQPAGEPSQQSPTEDVIEEMAEEFQRECLPEARGATSTPAAQASAAPPLEEPTPEQLKHERELVAEDERALRKRESGRASGVDLMATYMEQLSHIPLLQPQEEIDYARELETHELRVWQLILGTPKAVLHLESEGQNLEADLRQRLGKLLSSYRRAAARTRQRELPSSTKRTRDIEALAFELRSADYDNELLDTVLQRMRREVWGRRVLDATPAFRITHARLSEIEQHRQAGLDVRNRFVRANLRLVVSVARNFHHYRIPFIDLIQEGNVGLMKAVHRFDHRRGFRFSTYAHWWIRQSIERAIINKGSQVRLPVHVIDSRRQVARAAAQLTQKLERKPTAKEIAQKVEMPVAKVEQVLNGVQQDPVSLDDSVGHDDPRKFVDMVRDSAETPVDEGVIRANTHARIKELLSRLNPIEKDIIRRRFGLGDDSDQTLDEIGKQYNLSRERVRQIQAQGLMKMRRMCERRRIG